MVSPGAIAAAEAAARQAVCQRDQVRDALSRDLEAAQYATDRAFRQYDASDPENRLVTAELEARWNRMLQRVQEIEQKIAYHDTTSSNATTLPVEDLAALGTNLERVWFAPGTDAKLKKRIVRTVIREVVADLDDDASEIVLLIHWAGGAHTKIRLPKRQRGQRNATPPDIVEAVRQLARIASDDVIAGVLNRNGCATGNGNRWTRERVTALRSEAILLTLRLLSQRRDLRVRNHSCSIARSFAHEHPGEGQKATLAIRWGRFGIWHRIEQM